MYSREKERLKQKQVSNLISICKGILMDGVVNQAEAAGLLRELENSELAVSDSRLSHLMGTVNEMMEDGILDDDESARLLEILEELTGKPSLAGDRQRSAAAEDNPPPQVIFEGKNFVLTGIFAFGEDKGETYQLEIEKRGGIVQDRLTKRDTDFLVVGYYAEPRWRYVNYGDKIEKAMKWREAQERPAIITEKHLHKILDPE